ncbi:UNVERIFIED_CONTAM: hypothetical protein PYX00_002464 [Menopon gallinae]|uniref:Uncharacterized protein n=1 Tax=Menopon gallinae TaxID=328185 RepID=A0AAW2IHD7_9NEOP
MLSSFFLWFSIATLASGQRDANRLDEFVKLFSDCHSSDRGYFDECMRNALNNARAFFKTGVPELNVGPFDPFFAEEIVQERGGQSFRYRLTLRNVYERGWTHSEVTDFRSDLTNANIRYHQWFPEKYLQGEWEIVSNILSPFTNSGTFDLSLYNYTQVTTVQKIGRGNPNPERPFSVHIQAIDSGNLELHITNLLKGKTVLETLLDRAINIGWRPGFHLLKPLIDDLVSTAFTKIFNDYFHHFPFDAVIPR